MKMQAILKISIVALAVIISGCSASKDSKSVYDQGVDETRSAVVTGAAVEDTMNSSRERLGRMGFKFDKFDTASGYLRTEPLGGSQFFELWRDENVGAYNAAMSNINSVARIVEMNFNQIGDDVYVDCTAHINQLSLETGDLQGVSDMKNAFTKSSGGFQRLSIKGGNAGWKNLGRDAKLEELILSEISE